MKKRLFALFLSLSMVFGLASCGSQNGTGAAAGEAETEIKSEEKASEEAPEADEKAQVKVGIVTDVGGVNDGSFNQSAWEGLQRAQLDLGIEASYLESSTDADYIPNIETFVDEGYDMIVCIGYQLADALKQEAEAYPDQKFAIVDDSSNADLPNVTCLMFEQAQASYLVGYVAGLVTKTDTIGFVLGMSTDTMNQFGYGYLSGALDANSNVTVLQANANSFADTAAGKTAANNMIADNADVIFHAAGGTGLGVIDACKEAGIWAIGVDSDQSVIAPETIITSAMKRVDNAVYDIAKATQEGNVVSGVKTYTLEDAGVDIAPTTDNLSDDVIKAVNEVKDKIIKGEITVPKDREAFEAAHGDVYKLAD